MFIRCPTLLARATANPVGKGRTYERADRRAGAVRAVLRTVRQMPSTKLRTSTPNRQIPVELLLKAFHSKTTLAEVGARFR